METVERTRAAELQRRRRQALRRIDYLPSQRAQIAIEAERARNPKNSSEATNRAVLNRIVLEWAESAGIDCGPPEAESRPVVMPNPNLFAEPRRKEVVRNRVVCGAKRHRDGQPCEALSEPGKRRCRFHGGRSTGPRTPEGKARSAANLPNRKRASDA